MTVTDSIVTIQDLLSQWRELGSEVLDNGIELIGQADETTWLHVVLPGQCPQAIADAESALRCKLPKRLNALYRCLGGLSLFQGAFELYSPAPAPLPDGRNLTLTALVQEVDRYGWRPNGAVPFAINAWDGSVHCASMGRTAEEIVRCDPETGEVVERHVDALHCISSRLSKLDALAIN